MTTKTEIFKLALHRLGTERIISADTNTNKRTALLNDIYSVNRRKLLRHHFWNFSLRRAKLAQLTTKPAFGYEYEYALPADYLKVWIIADDGTKIKNLHPTEFRTTIEPEYVVEGNKILTDLKEVYIIYGADIVDTTQYNDTFIEALYLTLASKSCYSITQDKDLTKLILSELEKFLGEARTDSSQEYSAPDSYMIEDFTSIRGN